MPHDYPNWQNVRYHYDIWSKPNDDGISPLDRILRKLVELERKENDRSSKTTMIIVDSKSIQNADTAENKGYDAGKNFRNQAAYRSGCFRASSFITGSLLSLILISSIPISLHVLVFFTSLFTLVL